MSAALKSFRSRHVAYGLPLSSLLAPDVLLCRGTEGTRDMRNLHGCAALILFTMCAAAPAGAQTTPTLLQQATSADGLLRLSLWSANPADAVDVNNTYT